MNLPIETERLRLRRYEDRDLGDILAFTRDADFWLARNMKWPATEDGVREYWEAQRDIDPATDPRWFDLVVELKAEHEAIGSVGLGFAKSGGLRQGTIGWLLARKHQGRGLATEAVRALVTTGFRELGLHRISARTGRDNVRSWRLMERLGMRREAHFRESHEVKGRWGDEFVYAILADEWPAPGRSGEH
jgi:RimJ/RimL family protein N-acetyltransferase